MIEKITFTYDFIQERCNDNYSKIKSEFNPDVILSIGGGGLIPTRMLRKNIDLPIYVVTLSTYDENNNPIDTPRDIQWMDFSELKDKRILIVDEVDDTRKTLMYLVDKLVNKEGLNRDNLGVFVIHNKLKEKYESNKGLDVSFYLACDDVAGVWIVYPWE